MSGGRPAGTAGAHGVIAELALRPERLDAFVALASAFAAECLACEPGCRQFQVLRLASPPQGVLFFEAYDDAAAFEAHRASGHLARFQAAFQGWLTAEQPFRQGRLVPAAP